MCDHIEATPPYGHGLIYQFGNILGVWIVVFQFVWGFLVLDQIDPGKYSKKIMTNRRNHILYFDSFFFGKAYVLIISVHMLLISMGLMRDYSQYIPGWHIILWYAHPLFWPRLKDRTQGCSKKRGYVNDATALPRSILTDLSNKVWDDQ